jgi:hypothetical protein
MRISNHQPQGPPGPQICPDSVLDVVSVVAPDSFHGIDQFGHSSLFLSNARVPRISIAFVRKSQAKKLPSCGCCLVVGRPWEAVDFEVCVKSQRRLDLSVLGLMIRRVRAWGFRDQHQLDALSELHTSRQVPHGCRIILWCR